MSALRHSVPLRLLACTAALWAGGALADEADIRKALAERLPNLPKIDEVRPAPVPGLFEVRLGTELIYTDPKGLYVIQGEVMLVQQLTESIRAMAGFQRSNRKQSFEPDSIKNTNVSLGVAAVAIVRRMLTVISITRPRWT